MVKEKRLERGITRMRLRGRGRNGSKGERESKQAGRTGRTAMPTPGWRNPGFFS
jgi:hypothetical protein